MDPTKRDLGKVIEWEYDNLNLLLRWHLIEEEVVLDVQVMKIHTYILPKKSIWSKGQHNQ